MYSLQNQRGSRSIYEVFNQLLKFKVSSVYFREMSTVMNFLFDSVLGQSQLVVDSGECTTASPESGKIDTKEPSEHGGSVVCPSKLHTRGHRFAVPNISWAAATPTQSPLTLCTQEASPLLPISPTKSQSTTPSSTVNLNLSKTPNI